jgi:hypothetical protein
MQCIRTNLLHICISMYAQAGNHDSIEDSRAALALYRKYEQVRIDGQMNKRGRDCYSALGLSTSSNRSFRRMQHSST